LKKIDNNSAAQWGITNNSTDALNMAEGVVVEHDDSDDDDNTIDFLTAMNADLQRILDKKNDADLQRSLKLPHDLDDEDGNDADVERSFKLMLMMMIILLIFLQL
jgi:hypothetical protein